MSRHLRPNRPVTSAPDNRLMIVAMFLLLFVVLVLSAAPLFAPAHPDNRAPTFPVRPSSGLNAHYSFVRSTLTEYATRPARVDTYIDDHALSLTDCFDLLRTVHNTRTVWYSCDIERDPS